MQEGLQEGERLWVVKDDRRDPRPVGHAVVSQDLLAETLHERLAHVGSVRRRWWTISSLDTVAAPWARKAARAVLFPAAIPPVIATVIGRERQSR